MNYDAPEYHSFDSRTFYIISKPIDGGKAKSNPSGKAGIFDKHMDHGYYIITGTLAKRMAGGKLPKIGYEKFVEWGGNYLILSRQQSWGKVYWTIRKTDWRPDAKGRWMLGIQAGENTDFWKR